MASVISHVKKNAIAIARRFPGMDRSLQILRRKVLSHWGGYPAWSDMTAAEAADWPAVLSRASGGQKVLIATSIGSHLPAMQMETTLAAALLLRGANIHALLCDQVLPGCQMCEPRFFPHIERFVSHGPQRDLCGHCFEPGRRAYRGLGVRTHAYSDSLSEGDWREADRLTSSVPVGEIKDFLWNGLRLGEHAKAGALRFFACATTEQEPYAEQVLRRYLKASLLTAMSVKKLLEREHFDVLVFHHGIYVPQGIIGEVARNMGVRVVNWNAAYRKNCFIFSHGDTYHHTLMDEPVSTWENLDWPADREAKIDRYLRSRWAGENDWIRFHEDPYFEKGRILAEIGCDGARPIIGCLTNVMWDAQLHYPANAFGNMLDWLLHTVRRFAERPEQQLVIRVHPAEIRGTVPTRQPVVAELKKHFPTLPTNVYVVPPESNISTYALAELCDSVIIYGTKTGVELTSVGIPVIVAGEAWIRNKGITYDADSVAGYDSLLRRLPMRQRLPPSTVSRAKKYAYHFFFRRMIPIQIFVPGPGLPPYRFSGRLEDLMPGHDAGLDCVCAGILEGRPFVYDE